METLTGSSRSRPKPIPPPLVLRDDVTTSDLLTEFAIIATSPRSQLLQRNLPIRKRSYTTTSSSLENIHSYAVATRQQQQQQPPPPGVLSPPSSLEEIPSSPNLDGLVRRFERDLGTMTSSSMGSGSHHWPTAVWHCFLRGTRVRFGSCGGSQTRLAEDLDGSSVMTSRYAPNGLRLLEMSSSEGAAAVMRLTLTPVAEHKQQQPDLQVELSADHPFFVKGKGWCSAAPAQTLRTFGIPCQRLDKGDICLPPSHPEATTLAPDFGGYEDLTPEDASAALALSCMAAMKTSQLSPSPTTTTTMSPPASPRKPRCPTAAAALASPKPKRPMNGFMLFAKKHRIEYTQLNPGNDNRAISVLLGERWKNMSADERATYAEEARVLAEKQKQLYPDCWKRRRSSSSSSGGAL